MIDIKFRVYLSDSKDVSLFNSISDASKYALLISQDSGETAKIDRGVRYTHQTEYNWSPFHEVSLPEGTSEDIVALEDK